VIDQPGLLLHQLRELSGAAVLLDFADDFAVGRLCRAVATDGLELF
jgi:hypothetical protein